MTRSRVGRGRAVLANDNNGHDDSLLLFLSFNGHSMNGVQLIVGVELKKSIPGQPGNSVNRHLTDG